MACWAPMHSLCNCSVSLCCRTREYLPLYNGALGLPEALLLVSPSCVWHIPCELGLHCNVIFQGHVADLRVTDKKSKDGANVQAEL